MNIGPSAYRLLVLAALFLLMPFAKAQVTSFDTISQRHVTADTTILSHPSPSKTVKRSQRHSPRKAGILSACLPGAGQIYNRKWGKTPVIYAGLGGLGYLAYNNYSSYRLYLLAYRVRTGSLNEGEFPSEKARHLAERYQDNQLQAYKESYQRDFELFTILTVAWYGLNIIDAIVDGHLYTYDISDDLSFSIDPQFYSPSTATPYYAQVGLTLKLDF